MKKLFLILFALFHMAYAQTLDSLRIHYEKDVADLRFNDSVRRGSKLAYGDSILSRQLMTGHILPTPDALALIRSLNPSFGTYPYYTYDTTNLALPVVSRMTGKERRRLRRSIRRDGLRSPQFEAIFSLQLDTLVSIRNLLKDSTRLQMNDDNLVNRLTALNETKVNKGRMTSRYIEEMMDRLIDQYRVLRNGPSNLCSSTIENIQFLAKLVIGFLPPTDQRVGVLDAEDRFPNSITKKGHLSITESAVSFDNLPIAPADTTKAGKSAWAQSDVVSIQLYVYDSTSVRLPDNVLTDTNMQSKYIIYWRLPLDEQSSPSIGRASKVNLSLPIVDHYFSASFDGTNKTKEQLIDLREYLIQRPLTTRIKDFSPYIILINIHDIRHS